MSLALTKLAYLVASILFIMGLKGLTRPRTAVRGNMLGALAMLIAVAATLLYTQILSPVWLILGLVIGGGAGAYLAKTVKMTDMPQMVALFNGFGGIASVLVAGYALHEVFLPDNAFTVATAASGLIGAVTLTGSLIAAGKLQEVISGNAILFNGQKALNAGLLLLALACAAWLVGSDGSEAASWILVLVSFVLGVTLVIPIGGADMPVVIALLNSYSGLAASATGFVLGNDVLIIAGALVGASGLILTKIMCVAMNRSLANVLFGGVGAAPAAGAGAGAEIYEGKIKATSGEELAMLMDGARKVVIVPGYGMAVAQAQHAVRDLANLLEEKGIDVEFAIHPVAGRMPGHMNVLLAEANIPYDKLLEMDVINPTFPQVDIAIVLGANDVVNPVARTDPSSPIAGMPILDVDKAKTVVMIKRSLSPGFAGIPNPLFAADNTLMFFGDGKQAILDTIAALKEG